MTNIYDLVWKNSSEKVQCWRTCNSDWLGNNFTVVAHEKKIFTSSLDKKILTELKKILIDNHDKTIYEQESPPAGNRKRRTDSSIICPSLTVPGGGGYPHPGVCSFCWHFHVFQWHANKPVIHVTRITWIYNERSMKWTSTFCVKSNNVCAPPKFQQNKHTPVPRGWRGTPYSPSQGATPAKFKHYLPYKHYFVRGR